MNLLSLGWNSFFEEQFLIWKDSGLFPGRVISSSGYIYQTESEFGRFKAQISGHFQYFALSSADYPVVGDWVLLRDAGDLFIIEKVLERKSFFSRSAAGKRSDEQVIVSNIDIMFIVAALDGGRNFTQGGLERYITMVHDGGALPVILLNKCDLCSKDKVEDFVNTAQIVARDIEVIPVSALTGESIDKLRKLLKEGITAAFTGPSGVGKSALINSLVGSTVQKTGEVRSDDKRGRHTTTHKELFFLPDGAMIIDTPGLRELVPYGDVSSLDMTFSEISKAAFNCRFKNCSHRDEPGCAVLRLVEEGEIAYERYSNYMAMKKEIIENERRKSEKWHLEQKAKDKALSKIVKNYYKEHKQ